MKEESRVTTKTNKERRKRDNTVPNNNNTYRVSGTDELMGTRVQLHRYRYHYLQARDCDGPWIEMRSGDAIACATANSHESQVSRDSTLSGIDSAHGEGLGGEVGEVSN